MFDEVLIVGASVHPIMPTFQMISLPQIILLGLSFQDEIGGVDGLSAELELAAFVFICWFYLW